MRIINRYRSVLLLGGLLLGVTACGGGNPTATNTPAPAATVAAVTTVVQPTSGATVPAAPSAASQVTEIASSSPAITAAARPNSPYAAMPQSKTAEGYYALGEPNAPVVMNYYSDFL
jgi:protein-disulfide isomerase